MVAGVFFGDESGLLDIEASFALATASSTSFDITFTALR